MREEEESGQRACGVRRTPTEPEKKNHSPDLSAQVETKV